EDAIREGAKQVRQERERSVDPTVSASDAEQAAQRSSNADLKCQRLTAALVRLRARLTEALQQERRERWSARYARHNADCDALGKELAETYNATTAKLVELLQRIEACDRDSSAINHDAPDDEHKRLGKVELIARQLEQFTSNQPS